MRTSRFLAAALLAAIALHAGAAKAEERGLYLPGAAEITGEAGARFSSTLLLTNLGTAPLPVKIGLVPAPGAPAPAPVTRVLAAGETQKIAAALTTLFGAGTTAGTFRLEADGAMTAFLVTANVADPAGTYGTGLSPVPTEALLGRGDVAQMIWVTQAADQTAGFRTNVAITFVDPGSAAEVRVHDRTGVVVGHLSVGSAQPAAWQAPLSAIVPGALDLGRVEVQVVSGRALAYTVVNDNLSSDGLVTIAQREGDAAADQTLQGAVRDAEEGVFLWGTDLRLWNPDASTPLAVRLEAVGAATSSTPLVVTVAPRNVVEVLDLLTAVGLERGTSAAIRASADRPFLLAARSARLDRTGNRPGSYATALLPITYPSALFSPGRGVSVVGTEDSRAVPGGWTVISLIGGPSGGAGTLTLRDAQGAGAGEAAFSVGPLERVQKSLQEWFVGGVTPPTSREGAEPASLPEGGRVDVRVGEGAVDVLALRIDNGTGDPIAQRPTGDCGGSVPAVESFSIDPVEPQVGTPATLRWTLDGTVDAQEIAEAEHGTVRVSANARSVVLTFDRPGPHTAVLTVRRGCRTASGTLRFDVVCGPAPDIQPSSLPGGSLGTPYGPIAFTQTGGATPVTWSATGLPAGIGLTAGGVLSGTPTASGSFSVTVTVTDANGCKGSRTLVLAICGPLPVGPGSLPPATLGQPYGPVQMTAAGGTPPLVWTAEGPMPPGIVLSPDGVLSGLPTEAGRFDVPARVTDANGCTGVSTLSLLVLCPSLSIEPSQLPPAQPGVPYGPITFTLVGGHPPVTWTATGLPPGLTLSSGGVLSGTPSGGGVFTVVVRARDSAGCTQERSIPLQAESAPSVVATIPANGATQQPVNVNVIVTFSEPVAVSGFWFEMTCTGISAPITITPSSALVTGGPVTYTVDPFFDLPPGYTSCQVRVVAALVADVDTYDPPDTMLSDHLFSFGLDQPPAVSATLPATGALAAADTNLVVTFDEPVAVAGSWFQVVCAQAFVVDPSNSVVTGGPTVFTIDPVPTLPAGACNAAVFRTAVSDLDAGDPPDQPVADHFWSFSVDAAPAVVSTNPPDGATGVAPSTPVTVGFSEPVNVSAASFRIECPSGTVLPFALAGSGTAIATLTPSAPLPGGETCVVTVVAAQVQDVDAVDPPDNLPADHVFGFSIALAATNDVYPQTVIGNVDVDSSRIPFSVTTNDVFGTGTTVTAYDAVTPAGGDVAMTTSGPGMGEFVYRPPTGFTGTDTFSYTIGNGTSSATATVTLNVSTPIWFVTSGLGVCPGGPCDGRLSRPFAALSGFVAVNDGAPLHPGPGHAVFLFESVQPHLGPLPLLPGQRVVGQDATAPLAAILGIAVPSGSDPLPTMIPGNGILSLVTSPGVGVLLGVDNLLRGLTVGDSPSVHVAGVGFGTLTVAEVSLTGNGQALELVGGTLNAAFADVSTTGSAGNGVRLENTTGAMTAASGALTGSQGAAFQVVGGSPTVTFGASVTHGPASSIPTPVVDVAGTTGGSITFGAPVAADHTQQGVRVTNAAGSLTFTTLVLGDGPGSAAAMLDAGVLVDGLTGSLQLGTVTIYTSGSPGIAVTNTTGTVGSAGGLVDSEFAAAVDVQGGAGVTPLAMTLTTVNTAFASPGILLSRTSGTFAVTGVGTTPASGGTITEAFEDGVRLREVTGVTLKNLDIPMVAFAPGPACLPGIATDCSAGIDMNVASNVLVEGVRIGPSSETGIFGYAVSNLTVKTTTISDIPGMGQPARAPRPPGARRSSPPPAPQQLDVWSGLYLVAPAGSLVVEDSLFQRIEDFGVAVTVPAGNYTASVTGTTFDDVGGVEGGGAGVGVDVLGTGVVTALVDGGTFQNTGGLGVLGVSADPATGPELNLTVRNSTYLNGHEGFVVVAADLLGKANVTVDNNQVSDFFFAAITLSQVGLSLLDATVTNNVIDDSAVTFEYAHGVELFQEDEGTLRARIEGNTMTGLALSAVRAVGLSGDLPSPNAVFGNMHLTLTGNTGGIPEVGDDGAYVSTDSVENQICLSASGNTFAAGALYFGMRVLQGVLGTMGPFDVQGMTPGPVTAPAVAAFLESTNTITPSASATGSTFTGAAPGTCALPLPTPLF